jgi:hypothetical protein
MPIISDLFQHIASLFDSDYYGFINSDVLLSYNVFEVLESCKRYLANGIIKQKVLEAIMIHIQHEISGRTHIAKPDLVLNATDLLTYSEFIRSCKPSQSNLRSIKSAVSYLQYS